MIDPIRIDDDIELHHAGRGWWNGKTRRFICGFQRIPKQYWSLHILVQEEGGAEYSWQGADGTRQQTAVNDSNTIFLLDLKTDYELKRTHERYKLLGITLRSLRREPLENWLNLASRVHRAGDGTSGPGLSIQATTNKLSSHLEEISWEYEQRKVGVVSAARGYLELIKSDLERRGAAAKDAQSPALVGPVAVRMAYEYFSEHLDQDVNLTEVSRALGLSPNGLMAAFRNHGAKSPMVILRELRMNKAQELLSREPLRVKEIAAAVGYPSNDVFCRAYKRQFGCSPLQSRRQTMLAKLR